MSDKNHTNSSSTQNPAKNVNPPSLPTKSIRGEVVPKNTSSGGGKK